MDKVKNEERILKQANQILRRRLNNNPVLSSPSLVKDYLCTLIGNNDYEAFVVIFLTNGHQIIKSEEMFRGSISSTSVYPREVLIRALQLKAAAVIFAHNHVSGFKEPSDQDKYLTDRLKKALETVDIRVLDHLIICFNDTVSFSELGLL